MSIQKTCDIIVPTYNNAHTLPRFIEGLNIQDIPDNWQIQLLLCDDGSTDETETITYNLLRPSEALREGGQPTTYPLVYLPDKHKGISAARNRGIKHSKADIILFLGSDIILRLGALTAHLQFHASNPYPAATALGIVQWDPRCRPTPLMEWMNHGGPQNNFDALLGTTTIDPSRYFYGSHLSLKREMLTENLFNEKFTSYGWEDIELGRRLGKAGLQLHLLPTAVGLHYHHYTADNFFRRQYLVGKNKHLIDPAPASKLTWRHRLQNIVYPLGPAQVLRSLVRFAAPRYSMPRIFAHMANYEYRRGIYAKDHSLFLKGDFAQKSS